MPSVVIIFGVKLKKKQCKSLLQEFFPEYFIGYDKCEEKDRIFCEIMHDTAIWPSNS